MANNGINITVGVNTDDKSINAAKKEFESLYKTLSQLMQLKVNPETGVLGPFTKELNDAIVKLGLEKEAIYAVNQAMKAFNATHNTSNEMHNRQAATIAKISEGFSKASRASGDFLDNIALFKPAIDDIASNIMTAYSSFDAFDKLDFAKSFDVPPETFVSIDKFKEALDTIDTLGDLKLASDDALAQVNTQLQELGSPALFQGIMDVAKAVETLDSVATSDDDAVSELRDKHVEQTSAMIQAQVDALAKGDQELVDSLQSQMSSIRTKQTDESQNAVSESLDVTHIESVAATWRDALTPLLEQLKSTAQTVFDAAGNLTKEQQQFSLDMARTEGVIKERIAQMQLESKERIEAEKLAAKERLHNENVARQEELRVAREKAKAEEAAAKEAARIQKEAANAAKKAADEAAKEAARVQKEAAKAAKKDEEEAAKEAARLKKEAAKEAKKAEDAAAKAAARAQREAAKEAARAQKEAANAAKKAEEEAAKEAARTKKEAADDLSEAFDTGANAIGGTVTKASSTIRNAFSTALGILSAMGFDELTSGLADMTKEAINYASHIKESENLLRSVYSGDSEAMLEWADNNAKAYMLSEVEAKDYLANINAILSSSGIQEDDMASVMSLNITKLAGDLASAYDRSAEEVYEDLRSAFSGQARALLSYGISLNIENLNSYLDSKGIDARMESMSQYNRQIVRYAYIMQQTAEVQGDFYRTSGSFANTLKTLKTEFQDLLTLIGSYAVPILQPILEQLRVIIAYAGAVIKLLAEMYGLEQYETPEVDYSYKEILEDGEEATDNTADNLKDVNKELKKGVKLLDLYTLDFGDSSAKLDSSKGITDDLDDLSFLLDDIQPYDFEKDFGIDIDMVKAKKIAEDIKGTLDTIAGIITFIAKDISWIFGLKWYELAAQIAALSVIKVGFKFAWDSLKEFIKNSPEKFKKIGGTIAGSIAAGIGGYTLGQALYDGLNKGEWSISKIGLGLVESLGGIIMAGVAGGPIGIAIATVISAFSGLASYTLKFKQAIIDNTLEFSGAVSSAGYDFDIFKQKLSGDVDMTAVTTVLTYVEEGFTNISEKSRDLIDVTIPNLLNSLSTGTDVASISDISSAFDNLWASLDNVYTKMDEAKTDTLEGVLTSLQTTLNLTSTDINNYITAYDELLSSLREAEQQEYEDLAIKKASGNITDEELKRFEFLEQKLGVISETISTMPSIQIGDLTTAPEAIKSGVESATQELDALKVMIDELNSSLDSKNITDEQRGEITNQIDVLKNLYNLKLENLKKTYNEAMQSYSDSALATFRSTSFITTLNQTSGIDSSPLVEAAKKLGKDGYEAFKEGFTQQQGSFFELNPEQEAAVRKELLEKIEGFDELTADEQKIAIQLTANVDWDILSLNENATMGARSAYNAAMKAAADGLGVAAMETDGLVTSFDVPFDLSVDINSIAKMEPLNPMTEKELQEKIKAYYKAGDTAAEESGKQLGNKAADTMVSSTEDNLNSEENITAVTDSVTTMLEGVNNDEDAKAKGNSLATSLIQGLTEGISKSLKDESTVSILNTLGTKLNDIPKSFKSAFDTAINEIKGALETLKGTISSVSADLDKLTSYDIASATSRNPYVQASSSASSYTSNTKAPSIQIIRDNQSSGTSQTVELNATIYIGTREINDYIIDVVTSNDNSVG